MYTGASPEAAQVVFFSWEEHVKTFITVFALSALLRLRKRFFARSKSHLNATAGNESVV